MAFAKFAQQDLPLHLMDSHAQSVVLIKS